MKLPEPQPCHNCSHVYLGASCPICKEDRPSYAMLKRLVKEEQDKAQMRRLAEEAI